MKLRIAVTTICATLFFSLVVQTQTKNSFNGLWQGSMKVGETSLRMVIKIVTDSTGKYGATMDSPDQGVKGIPIDSVIAGGNMLRLVLPMMSAHFDGSLRSDSAIIDGNWTQGGRSLPLIFRKIDKIAELNRPQEPKKPYPYKEENVQYENKQAGIVLAGTLTTPSTGGPFSAVVLITGSGPQDRDEKAFDHKPFLVISDYLTRAGIAVLRVDDRGIGKSTGKFSDATTMDFATDVRAGIEFLKTRGDVDTKKIGLIGHSEGGLIAPIVASQTPEVAFIVMMAGPGVNGEEIILRQSELISRANGEPDSSVSKSLAQQKKVFAIINQEPDTAILRVKLRSFLKETAQSRTDEAKKNNPISDAAIEGQVRQMTSPWFRFFLAFDPKPVLAKVHCPVLVLNGEKDLQVSPKQNLPAIEGALKTGKNSNYTIVEIPGVNHLFQSSESGSPREYRKIEETMSPNVLELVSEWIKKQ